ncbi:hypothetical protein [Moorena sp. SIO4A1]|uniref:hypothetical protein n=1 Tax=Moorena sp. SIO4A1 TaxID=2607835 RepID=UPI0025D14F22|nr:hypothetical protein [Moorena sp. SIO4A1]
MMDFSEVDVVFKFTDFTTPEYTFSNSNMENLRQTLKVGDNIVFIEKVYNSVTNQEHKLQGTVFEITKVSFCHHVFDSTIRVVAIIEVKG